MPVWCVVELRDRQVKKGVKILAGIILTIFALILGLIIFWSFAYNSSRANLVNWYQYLTGQSSELNPGNILRVNGSVSNPGTAEFSLIELQAKVYDEQGNLLGNSTQYIDSSLLSPGERFRFRLDVNSLLSSLNAGLSNQQVLQYDDFSDQSSGWANASFDEGETVYQAGQYHILVNKINYDVWSTSGREYGDVKIEVDATKLAGPESNRYGILCRYVDTDNYYFAVISSDGYYGIGKVVDGYQTFLHENGMLITDKVYSGSTLNHIRFDCVGTRLSLYINGDYVDAVDDSEFSVGDVGLLAGTFEKKGTKVSFDNFVVINP